MFFLFLLSFLSCETVETKMDKKEILESKVVLRIESENRAFYSYPRSDMFRSGDFDIKSVEVRDLNDSYVLILEVGSAFTNNLSLIETLLSSFFVLVGLLPSDSCLSLLVKVIIWMIFSQSAI